MAPGWFGCPTGGWRGGPCAAVCCHLSTGLQPHGHRGGRGRDGTAYTCTPTPACSVHLDLALDLLVDIVEKGAQSFLFDFAILTRLWPPSRRLKTAVYTIVCQLRKQLQVASRFVLPAVEATGGMRSSRESAVLPWQPPASLSFHSLIPSPLDPRPSQVCWPPAPPTGLFPKPLFRLRGTLRQAAL